MVGRWSERSRYGVQVFNQLKRVRDCSRVEARDIMKNTIYSVVFAMENSSVVVKATDVEKVVDLAKQCSVYLCGGALIEKDGVMCQNVYVNSPIWNAQRAVVEMFRNGFAEVRVEDKEEFHALCDLLEIPERGGAFLEHSSQIFYVNNGSDLCADYKAYIG